MTRRGWGLQDVQELSHTLKLWLLSVLTSLQNDDSYETPSCLQAPGLPPSNSSTQGAHARLFLPSPQASPRSCFSSPPGRGRGRRPSITGGNADKAVNSACLLHCCVSLRQCGGTIAGTSPQRRAHLPTGVNGVRWATWDHPRAHAACAPFPQQSGDVHLQVGSRPKGQQQPLALRTRPCWEAS